MKKILVLCLSAFALASCGGSQKSDGSVNDSVSTSKNLTEKSEGNNEQGKDNYAIWQMDSTKEVNFVTYDLAAMEVRGHVSKIEFSLNGLVVKFDENGRIASYVDESSSFQFGYNDDGCLSVYAVGAGSSTYSINPEADLLACYSGGEGAYSWINNYNYDDKGNLIEIEYNDYDEAENSQETTVAKVKVIAADSHGNWIKRKVGDTVHTRTISYYPNPLGGDEGASSARNDINPLVDKCTFMGAIGGEKNSTLSLENGTGSYSVKGGERIVYAERFSPSTGQLVLGAYHKNKGNSIGMFDGTFKNCVYKGVFENHNGGKVDFELVLK